MRWTVTILLIGVGIAIGCTSKLRVLATSENPSSATTASDGNDPNGTDPENGEPIPSESDPENPPDVTPPAFVSLLGTNGAADGSINQSEYLSPLPLLQLTARDYLTALYSEFLDENSGCDASLK